MEFRTIKQYAGPASLYQQMKQPVHGLQGFTKEITMDRERWHGYIKDYDGGTLMECHIHPKLPHTTLPVMLRKQKQVRRAQFSP
jgi:hypothetical protein